MIDSTRKKKILLAEDDSSMRRFIEIILQQAGYEVLTAEDGLQALQMVQTNGIDALVADAVMPHLTGYDLCRVLRSQTKNLPMIILSGLEQNNQSDDDCIADIFLVKNASLKNDLTSALEKLLSAKT
ncbi:MAG TPA: response regulator [Pyrinomonadaceae bacterium]|jgi:CheY-like chemotaxis protein